MSSEPFIGTIGVFGGNFAPAGPSQWLPCDGRLLPISQYETLYSLIGTTYGGNGQTTFALPNVQGCAMIHQGQRPGGPNYVIGQTGGNYSVTMTTQNMPQHTHAIVSGNIGINTDGATTNLAANGFPSLPDNGNVYASTDGGSLMGPGNFPIGIAGSSIPIDITNPYLAMTVCIAVEGIYPTQN